MSQETQKLITLLEGSLKILETWRNMYGLYINQDISTLRADFEEVKKELLNQKLISNKMEKLEFKHMVCYLPYGLKILREGSIVELCGLDQPYKTNNNYFIKGETKKINGTHRQCLSFCVDEKHLPSFKPLLVPLSAFNESKADAEIFAKGNYYMSVKINACDELLYWEVEILLKHHFDVFGLIPAGLALSKLEYLNFE